MNGNAMILSLMGGVLLLLYGVNLAGEGLKGWAGARIKTALETMTKNRFTALLTGIGITFVLQSSSASTVTVISLIDAGLMTFTQSLAVTLGAGIGATITVQLISFRIYDYSLFICGVGLLINFMSDDVRRKSAGRGVFGFGLILLSIMLLSDVIAPLKENELFQTNLRAVGDNPFLGIIVSLVLTAIIQSSAATIGLAITFAITGMMDLNAAVPIVLGANIGTCATGLISAAKSGTEAKRAAIAHALFRIIGVVLFLPFIGVFSDLMARTGGDVARQIANAHTVFNGVVAVVLLPFIGYIGKLVEMWVPDKTGESEEFKPKYLNPSMLQTPALALAQAKRESLRMAEIVQDMYKLTLPAIMQCDEKLIERVESMDDEVDILDDSIRRYLTQLAKEQLGSDEARTQMDVLVFISNMETIGDVIDTNLMELARKKSKKCVQFSREGQRDIEDLYGRVLENLELAISAVTTGERALAERVQKNDSRIKELEREYNRRHIERLESGLSESLETSSIHLDVLTNFVRVNNHVTNIVYSMLGSSLF